MTPPGSRSRGLLRRLLGRAVTLALLAVLELALRTLPVSRVIRACGLRPVPVDPDAPTATATAPTLRVRGRARLVRAGARTLGGRPRCLAQALTLVLLTRRGARDLTLHLGVGRDDAGAMRAHAWVRHGGVIVIGGEEAPDFVEVERFALG